MYPTLFTIGKLTIPTYTVLLDLGLVLGLVLTYFEGRRRFETGETALDLGLWTVIGGIIGGRIGYVLANWNAFSEDWIRALRIWEGGLAFHGAFLGGLLVIAIFALLQRRCTEPLSFWQLGDLLVPGLGLGLVFGWAACLMGACAYGILGEGFGYALLPDIYGVESWRFATQIVGIGQALALFVAFWLLRSRWPFSGAAFTMFGLLYFAGQFFLGFRRGDEALYLGPWRLPQAVDLILTLVAAVALMALWWQARGREGQPDLAEEATGDESLEPGHDDQADEQGEEGPEQIGEISQQDGALEVAREAVDSGNDAEATSSPDVVESQGSGESAEEIPRASE